MKKLSAIIIGAGGRGRTYCRNMHEMSDRYEVVGVAEPVDVKRNEIRDMCQIPEENCFRGWQEILDRPKMADIAVIATMDAMHYEPAMKAISLGYHLLLEKPVAPTAKECVEIAKAAEEKGVSVIVCHVLRYTPFYKTIKSILDSGMIGKVMSVEQVEAIGDIHFSHSFVRGLWHSEKETSPMVIAKTCHDLDIIQWLIGKPCKKVSSFGELTYFKAENAPEGAPHRCVDGTCPEKDTCPYNAYALYVENKENLWWKKGFAHIIATHPNFTDEELFEKLKETDYGLCVFHANNDMPDHQIVNMEFEGGVNATLNLNAFNEGGRYTRIFGTKGELYAFMSDQEIHVRTFSDKVNHKIPVQETEESIAGGHGGGDAGIVYDLYDHLCGTYQGTSVADIRTSVSNHLIGFAAEEARHEDSVVSIEDFIDQFHFQNA